MKLQCAVLVVLIAESAVAQQPYDLLLQGNRLSICTVAVRKECLNRFGSFREEMRYREDHELWLRLAYHDCTFYNSPEIFAKYRVHDSNFSINQDIGIREELEIINKWLHINPVLNDELGNKIKMKKLKRHAALYLYYIIKYSHLPKGLTKFY